MSIRVRLGLWYGTIFGVAILLFSVALYGVMARHLEDMLETAVSQRAEHLAAAIVTANEAGEPGDALAIPSVDTSGTPEIFIQVLGRDGAVLARSADLGGLALHLPTVPLRPREATLSVDGVRLKEVVLPAFIRAEVAAWVRVASTYRQRDMVLERLRWTLIGGGTGAVVVVGLLGATIAGRALSPVSEMTDTARAIALSRGFSRRLGAPRTTDELGQLAVTFNEMLASLEQAYTAQQRFTADASHELRAPLTSIRGNLELLDRIREMPEAERKETLRQTREEVERLTRLVNELLALARADAGQTLDLGPVELDALLVDVCRQALGMAKGVTVRMGGIEPRVVYGDGDRLKEVFLILVDNAIRYTPEGGTVTLSLRSEPPWTAMCVEDTGMGIAPEDLPHIFERFWRADRARSRDSAGAGLGLAIARWIVERHGGEIAVESAPGKGSTFTVRLPVSR